jgi:FkbH-like protein
VLAHLHTKKLIISDLDNTLWRGTIGEAGVSPILDRQTLLSGLKHKGVLLAVCSKNNPQDVSWHGNHLGASDFVAARINWDPKPHNLRSIESELKLKRKDFIFIDDSPLERELMATEFPEVVVLNPEDERTWRLLRLWTILLGRGSSEDRTSYYLNEKNRSQSLEASNSSGDLFEALSSLRLRVKVREAERSDLQRAVELINRTNQFNLCGTRTTFREMQGWLNSSEHKIIVGQAEDKFGNMGIVCVAVMQLSGRAAHIPVFVLSCRVIGYGVESAVLNYICANAQAAGAETVVGHMQQTSHNEPCRRMYPDAGFEQQEEGRWHSKASQIPVAAWLTVEHDLAVAMS